MPHNAIRYQRLRPEMNTSSLLALYRRSIASVDDRLYSPSQRHAWAQWATDPASADAQLRRGLTIMALVDGSAVGFAQLYPADLVNMLYVDDGWQKRGIGTTLVTQLETIARRQGVATLATRASDASLPLFQRLGFMPAQREQVVAGNGVTLMRTLMRKPQIWNITTDDP
ncbi:GNAT family N-acetyltransferase [Halomonadaceae bacterium KBTZ08]